MQVTVTIPNLPKVKAALAEFPSIVAPKMDEAIRRSIYEIERQAVPRTPVDTGRLRGSYTTEFRPLQGAIGPTVDYAIYVHEGTRYMTGRPFLKEGVEAAERAIERNFKKGLEDALNEVARKAR